MTDLASLLATNDRRLIHGATPAERKAVAIIRTGLRPRTPPFPERRAWPVQPLPLLRPYSRAWWRTLGAQLRQRVVLAWLEQTAPPCCLGYRYGHGWSHKAHAQAITFAGGPLELDMVYDHGADWLPRVEKRSRWAGYARVTDYLLAWDGPPAPCPTCQTPPPAATVRRWAEHVTRWRR